MSKLVNFASHLHKNGISRRSFLKFCSTTASLLALPPNALPAFSENLRNSIRPPVIWLSFQECTGCTESLTRSHDLTIEQLLFDYLSLDYHHTLQAASGEAAENARLEVMGHTFGKYLLIVDGSIPIQNGGVYSTIAGKTNLQLLKECIPGAAAVIAIGSCAAFGGLPAASPNPTGATSVPTLMEKGLISRKKLVNLPGCPPLPIAISGVLAHFLAFERFPALDSLNRPLSFYGNTVHGGCSRYHFYQEEKFAEKFDDEGARKGWCLFKLGCKGPVTHNTCSVYKWNQGTSFPIESGHPCIGCSEPNFWDRAGFYQSLDQLPFSYQGSSENSESDIEAGHHLYEDNCVYCHSDDPSEFKTDPDKISQLLRSGEIRSHRRLDFSEDQINILEKYLTSGKQ